MNSTSIREDSGRASVYGTLSYRPFRFSGYLVLGMISVGLAWLFTTWIDYSFSYDSYIRRLIVPDVGWHQRSIPFFIMTFFFWCLVELNIKAWRIVKRNRADLKRRSIRSLPRYCQSVTSLVQQLERMDSAIKKRYVCQRISSLINHLHMTNTVERGHEYLRHQTEIASYGAESGYTTIRVFIWAMPILGFIGTVLGIGLSVGEFSGFLTGNIDDIALVKQQLSEVASGMSYAFDTTLLGLVASLLAMLLASFVQKGEEDCLTQLEMLEMEILARLSPDRTGADQLKNILAEMATEVIVPAVSLQGETANHVYKLLTDMQQTQSRILRILSELSHPHEIRLVRAEKEPSEEPPSQ